jgi:UDP:flavonoid glycosyltransferase YjiC (YdhE family)
MRVLCTAFPSFGHIFAIIPTVWAMRAAGHDVLVLTTGEAVPAAANAGLPVIDVAPELDIDAIFRELMAERLSMAQVPMPRECDQLDVARFLGSVSDAVTNGAMRVATSWRPDLVVHTLMEGAGPVVAAKLGVPAVAHGFGFAGPEWGRAVSAAMEETYARHRVAYVAPVVTLDVAPPSMVERDSGLLMRYVPYNGSGVSPDWLLKRSRRPKVAVTLGTKVPWFFGVSLLQPIIEAASKVDADFLVLLGDADPALLGKLPPNVTVYGWIPLVSLISSCSVIIHHGGSGTTLTSLAAGVPHLVLPQGSDQFINAEGVVKRGIGLSSEPSNVDAELVQRLLVDDSIRRAAAEVRAEIASMPALARVVDTLLAGLRR